MACEVKYNTSHHAGATEAERLAHRLRDSGDVAHSDTTVHQGSSPVRHISHVHHNGYNRHYGEDDHGAPDVNGNPRTDQHGGGQ